MFFGFLCESLNYWWICSVNQAWFQLNQSDLCRMYKNGYTLSVNHANTFDVSFSCQSRYFTVYFTFYFTFQKNVFVLSVLSTAGSTYMFDNRIFLCSSSSLHFTDGWSLNWPYTTVKCVVVVCWQMFCVRVKIIGGMCFESGKRTKILIPE